MVYFNLRGWIFVPLGRTVLPVASHTRGQVAVAVSVEYPLRTDSTRGAGRTQAFLGVYHFHATFLDFLFVPKGANVHVKVFVLPATLYLPAIFILMIPA